MKNKNEIGQLIAEIQGIQHLMQRNRNLGFAVLRGLNKELDVRKQRLQEMAAY